MKISKTLLFSALLLALLTTTSSNSQTTQDDVQLKKLEVQVECDCWIFLEYKKNIELSTEWELIVGMDDAPVVAADETVVFNIIKSGYYKITSAPADDFYKEVELIIKIDIDNRDILKKKIKCNLK